LDGDTLRCLHIFLDKFTKNWLTGRDRYAIVKNAILWQGYACLSQTVNRIML